ncbi:hypothetical protein [Umezawaea sp. Da 62-37]|uniref:hypothetical protein n=1 Tax=Umezawaea sp. Da 62-37 TaxID=3075927 RepID=UPI0028F6EF83|nr:hypothetical protein [Umezawaea sp. Da 62-37]WNV88681.1 hypothetical protein RM788_10385 [Umezawaea sp. Da 62-37]
MTTAVFALIVLALLAYGLERNNNRDASPHTRLAGSHDVQDRDLIRTDADLRAASAYGATSRRGRIPALRPHRSA